MHLPLYIRHAHDFIARNTNNGDHVKSCSNLSQNNSWTCYFQQNTQNSTVTFSIIFCCIFFSYSVFPAPSVSLHILYHKPEIKKSTDWQLTPPPPSSESIKHKKQSFYIIRTSLTCNTRPVTVVRRGNWAPASNSASNRKQN